MYEVLPRPCPSGRVQEVIMKYSDVFPPRWRGGALLATANVHFKPDRLTKKMAWVGLSGSHDYLI
ncbi:hypothetical protein SODALDRAFT_332201 [Sodiomyces alkalinus F11]|uniref:Uncharacterized protein n=1 Tax=Sodiomyces alkalinus (strain CBS 110278 / VKM F-3762 / F11) TaxID=1314773 RepID=A0A3N2PZX3_SODAK|nr:hypothetical protein SODALDRAFT_332201 [Sodiomyces alkalinus F11]ROT40043.1 hypothetical protein SODALDRAFT_332201 [Sodiomyces alkalinus F11]